MSCVHYKFSSKLNYDTVTFDGLNITLADLKRQIMGRERLKAVDCGLQITNAQTKEEYKDDEALISKNSSVIIRRIPIGGVKASSKMYNIERFSEQNHFPVQNLPVGSSKGDRSSEHSHFSIGSSKGIDDHASSISLAQLSKSEGDVHLLLLTLVRYTHTHTHTLVRYTHTHTHTHTRSLHTHTHTLHTHTLVPDHIS
ncbi:E3 ubiquitin-protein ligase RBBP6-like [Oncorhynchus kisutch]|uniref:E3 ubiquitin-protein ligase RBBP6-like n=1 Tax=Oncorhynchus kisutch TaxID=8019 RepID=UPI0012DFC514|nr:E3 ubiquitin-protein ligase RBBP6-like [Oncorhynchus kisutch]